MRPSEQMKLALTLFVLGLVLTAGLVALWLPHFSLSQETNNWDVLIPLAIGSALVTVGAAAVIITLVLWAIIRSVLRPFVADRK